MASILEVSPGGQRFFNVFDAAPENQRDGPAQQQQTQQVRLLSHEIPRITSTNHNRR
jgi:hypothetical protein